MEYEPKKYPRPSIVRVLSLAGAGLLFASVARGQGGLTPPGVPAPTMKTLAQVEPRTPISSLPVSGPLTIAQPGSYYFTTNLTAATTGIILAASGVTVDLMGFELVGGIGSGITTDISTRTNCAVRNGTLRGSTLPGSATGSNATI
jgi:hypothetical protein